MLLLIKQLDGTPITHIRNMDSFQCQTKLNDEGRLVFSLSYNMPGLEDITIKKGQLVDVIYSYGYRKQSVLFSGYIDTIEPSNDGITVTAKDFTEYMKHRILRAEKTYAVGSAISGIVKEIYAYLSTISPLPFTIGKIDCDTTLAEEITFSIGTSFFDVISQLSSREKNLQFRVIDGTLDCSLSVGDTKEGVWKSNIYTQSTNNINSWKWSSSISTTPTTVITNDGGVSTKRQSGMLQYEKYVYEDTDSTAVDDDDIKLPKIEIDGLNEEWRNIKPGDRKIVNIIRGQERLNIEYMGIVQGITLSSSSGSLSVVIDIGDKIYSQKNILDKTLEHYGNVIGAIIKKL